MSNTFILHSFKRDCIFAMFHFHFKKILREPAANIIDELSSLKITKEPVGTG